MSTAVAYFVHGPASNNNNRSKSSKTVMLTTCCSTFLLSRLCKAPYDTIRRLIASQAIVERLSIGNSESMPSLHKCTNLVLIPNLVTRKLRNLEPFRHSFRYTRYLHTSPFVCKVKGKKGK